MQFEEKVIQNELPVFVEFKSDWSGPCHIVNSSLNELAVEFNGKFAFYALDYDQNKLLVEEYRIQKLPTVLFFCKGEIIDHLIGPNPKNTVRTKIVDIVLKGECKLGR